MYNAILITQKLAILHKNGSQVSKLTLHYEEIIDYLEKIVLNCFKHALKIEQCRPKCRFNRV